MCPLFFSLNPGKDYLSASFVQFSECIAHFLSSRTFGKWQLKRRKAAFCFVQVSKLLALICPFSSQYLIHIQIHPKCDPDSTSLQDASSDEPSTHGLSDCGVVVCIASVAVLVP